MDVIVPASLQPQDQQPARMAQPAERRGGNLQFQVKDPDGNSSMVDEQAVMDDAQKLGYQVKGHSDDGMTMTISHGTNDPIQVPVKDFISRLGYQVEGATPRHANYDNVDPKLAAFAAMPGLDPSHQQALIESDLKSRGIQDPQVVRSPEGAFYHFDPATRQYHSLTHTQKGHFGLDDAVRMGMGTGRFGGNIGGAAYGGAAGAAVGNLPGALLGGAAGGAAGGQAGDALTGGIAAALSPNVRAQYADQGVGSIAEEQSGKLIPDALAGLFQGGTAKLLPGLMKSGIGSTAAKVGGGAAEAAGNIAEHVGGYTSRAANAVAKGEGTLGQNLGAQFAAQAMGGPIGSAGLAADIMSIPGAAIKGAPRAAGWLGKRFEGIFPEVGAYLKDVGSHYAADTPGGVLEKWAGRRAASRAAAFAEENLPRDFIDVATARASRAEAAARANGATYDEALKVYNAEHEGAIKAMKEPFRAAAEDKFGAEESAKFAPYKKLLDTADSTAATINRGIYGATGAVGTGVETLGKILGRGGEVAGKVGSFVGPRETPIEMQLLKLKLDREKRRSRALQALGIPSNMNGKSTQKPQFAAN